MATSEDLRRRWFSVLKMTYLGPSVSFDAGYTGSLPPARAGTRTRWWLSLPTIVSREEYALCDQLTSSAGSLYKGLEAVAIVMCSAEPIELWAF